MKRPLFLIAAICLILASCGKEPLAVTGITVRPTTISLEIGDKYTLQASILPADASNKEVSWRSDDTAIATVDPATGEVVAVRAGSTTITATTDEGGKTATCEVTVTETGQEPEPIADILPLIPDPVFRAYCEYCMENTTYTDFITGRKIEIAAWDRDGDGKLSSEEAAQVIIIEIMGDDDVEKLSSLAGIEYFTGLTHLNCMRNNLSSLDITKNLALIDIDCWANNLTSLDVSKNTALIYLACGGNRIESLDVSKNTLLELLECGSNELTSLDVSKNTALTFLGCNSNYQLSRLNVSNNTALIDLHCYGCQLTSLDISNNKALVYFSCEDNQLISLDISQNTKITLFNCQRNPGNGEKFVVKAWFDNESIPSGAPPTNPYDSYHFTKGSWTYYGDGETITIDYQKVI